jgi:hypothetical protein
MTGLIWFVQVVHYPLFAEVDPERFPVYHAAHTRWTTWVVALPMLVELAAAGWLVVRPEPGFPVVISWLGFGLVLAVWGCTSLIQVPLHACLARGFDARCHAMLVASNWCRTGLWTCHALVASWQWVAWVGATRGGGVGQP